MAERKSGPPKPRQKIPVGSQARRALNCIPKADELFIANQTGVRVYIFAFVVYICYVITFGIILISHFQYHWRSVLSHNRNIALKVLLLQNGM